MRAGGNQIIEIMEREFPLDYLKQNADDFKLDYSELKILEFWLSCNTNLSQTKKLCIAYNDSHGGYYLKFGIGRLKNIVNKLYTKINIIPIVDEQGEILEQYSFIDYQVVDVKDRNYRVFIPKVNMKNFSNKYRVHDYLKKKLERVVVMKFDKGIWKETRDNFAREYKSSLKVLEKLTG